MPVLRPLPMVKVGVLGLKDDRETILSVLHDLGAVQVEPISKDALQTMEPEHGSELTREVGDQLIRFRGLKSALPPHPAPAPRVYPDLNSVLTAARTVTIDTEVGELKRDEDHTLTTLKGLEDELDVLTRFSFYTDRLEYLQAKHLFAFFGESSPQAYRELTGAIPGLSDADFLSRADGDVVRFLVAVRREQADQVSRLAQQKGVKLFPIPRRSGPASEVLPLLRSERDSARSHLEEIRARLDAIAREWYPGVAALEEALTIENRKLEVWTRLGAGQRTFALEGWVAKKDRVGVEAALAEATAGRAHVYEIPTHEEPPTIMWNPAGVKRYEFFIRFYSLPLSSEWDPTWVFAIAFPVFFGLMLGDIGYALIILLVSLWMIAGFPGRRGVPKFLKEFPKLIMPPTAMQSLAYTLVPGCLLGIGFGAVFNEFFGFHLLPFTILDPIDPTGHGLKVLLVLAGYIGLTMVVLGFVLGALKEYFHHHIRGALGKAGGAFFSLGISYVGLTLLRSGGVAGIASSGAFASNVLLAPAYAALGGGFVLLLAGEGGQGAMAVMEVVSHVLSYTRVVGILLASVILAFLIDMGATHFFGAGALGPLIAAVILIFGQGFNLVLAVFEPGIQGARLIFVEHFSKFYSGNGRAFRAFGTRRQHTVSPHAERLGQLGMVGQPRR
ncbi:MAG TPA: V-type ATP synthase subunit I [Thermoplasmata archaeon]|nr:V-type ATP synthase subunit I [Thermoplasmata archaeon]